MLNILEFKLSFVTDSTGTSEDDQKESMPASAIALDIPTSSEDALHSPSPSSSEVSLPSCNTSQPLNDVSDLELATKNLPSSPAQNSPTHLKHERMLSTGPDALKKTIKDLARSSVSLPRFQLLLEEVKATNIICNNSKAWEPFLQRTEGFILNSFNKLFLPILQSATFRVEKPRGSRQNISLTWDYWFIF